MREAVASLITTIPADCKDLTVHDVSHLDALWEMASTIAGPEYDLNPTEAFVLGAAILLHDAGMSAAAFPGGLNEIKQTTEWGDVAAATIRQAGIDPTEELINSPPNDLLPRIKFEVLRLLHASQAEKMATAKWSLGGDLVYLIEDLELRQALGGTIGRIAYSHHWDIERIVDELVDNVGAPVFLPPEWSVSERKVACLLRCADAAHIDRRRAPSILYASTRPSGVSDTHWSAQNKINKPAVRGGVLIYSSGQSYGPEDADAWWLTYDLIRMIDGEIRSSNAMLEDIGFPSFSVSRVLGADSPRSLSKHIRVDGWRPVDTEVKVSDPVHLAETLGGHHLYGRDTLAPVRELLQNAADAVRARRKLEGRERDWGSIRVTIEPDPPGSESGWLHVDDNGIGMTERVLCGPLIDFGKSIWNSSLLREEFPGLQRSGMVPIGKFGIGFFSIFELGKIVKVISRHFEGAVSDAKVLDFRALNARPILRPARPGELPKDFSTRVSVRISNVDEKFAQKVRNSPLRGYSERKFENAVLRLISMLDVKVEYNDKISGASFLHDPNVYEVNPHTFIDEVYADVPERERNMLKAAHAALMSPMEGEDGRRYGRAAILVLEVDQREYRRQFRGLGAVSVGGFLYADGRGISTEYVGVVDGTTDQASRQIAMSSIPEAVIAGWATRQAQLIDQNKFLKGQLLKICERIVQAGGDPGSLPYCFTSQGFTAYGSALAMVGSLNIVRIPLYLEYSARFKILNFSDLGPTYFELPLQNDVIVISGADSKLIDEDLARRITKEGRSDILLSDISDNGLSWMTLLKLLHTAWGGEPLVSIESSQIFEANVHSPPATRWSLKLVRPGTC
ncbi:ATP-binding protein [Caulobacter sp. BP25]|uniref:HD domain-containing protein n=1 Tax=Caulobacter sp. BP25 TaxID=2048900 RepID=UPI0013748111|nr:ATP-binding protein [Caulobacter sp. BP25]